MSLYFYLHAFSLHTYVTIILFHLLILPLLCFSLSSSCLFFSVVNSSFCPISPCIYFLFILFSTPVLKFSINSTSIYQSPAQYILTSAFLTTNFLFISFLLLLYQTSVGEKIRSPEALKHSTQIPPPPPASLLLYRTSYSVYQPFPKRALALYVCNESK